MTMLLFCTGCRADAEFEQPPCADGHGADCPDLVCVECGLALFSFVADDLRDVLVAPVLERSGAG